MKSLSASAVGHVGLDVPGRRHREGAVQKEPEAYRAGRWEAYRAAAVTPRLRHLGGRNICLGFDSRGAYGERGRITLTPCDGGMRESRPGGPRGKLGPCRSFRSETGGTLVWSTGPHARFCGSHPPCAKRRRTRGPCRGRLGRRWLTSSQRAALRRAGGKPRLPPGMPPSNPGTVAAPPCCGGVPSITSHTTDAGAAGGSGQRIPSPGPGRFHTRTTSFV